MSKYIKGLTNEYKIAKFSMYNCTAQKCKSLNTGFQVISQRSSCKYPNSYSQSQEILFNEKITLMKSLGEHVFVHTVKLPNIKH